MQFKGKNQTHTPEIQLELFEVSLERRNIKR